MEKEKFRLFKDGIIYFALCFVVVIFLTMILYPSFFSGGGSIFVLIIGIPMIVIPWIFFCLLQNIFNKDRNIYKAITFSLLIFLVVRLITSII